MSEIVIIGGGFAGVWAALSAARQVDLSDVDINISVISPDDYITIRPRLYESSPETLRAPLSQTLDPVSVNFIQGTVRAIDPSSQLVTFESSNGSKITKAYDKLIVTVGSNMPILPIPGLEENGWNIDSFKSAVALDSHLNEALKVSNLSGNNTFVILGAGFTGIELATEMRDRIEIHSDTETASSARIILVEQASVLASELGKNIRPAVQEALDDANIEVQLNTTIEKMTAEAAYLSNGEVVYTKTIIATVGQRANSLTEVLDTGRDTLGRIITDDQLRIKKMPNIFVAGDAAHAHVDEDHVALMSCQHAMTMGKYAGYNVARSLLGKPLQPYRQPNYVTCLHLGRFGGVFTRGWDREVKQLGIEVRQLKTQINTVRIYPPIGTREQILSASDIEPRSPL